MSCCLFTECEASHKQNVRPHPNNDVFHVTPPVSGIKVLLDFTVLNKQKV